MTTYDPAASQTPVNEKKTAKIFPCQDLQAYHREPHPTALLEKESLLEGQYITTTFFSPSDTPKTVTFDSTPDSTSKTVALLYPNTERPYAA